MAKRRLSGLTASDIQSAEREARAACDQRYDGKMDRDICYRGVNFLMTRMKDKGGGKLEGGAAAFVERWIEESKQGLPKRFKKAKIVRE